MIAASPALSALLMTGLATALDAGTPASTCHLFANTRPATAGAAAGASPVAVVPLNKPCGSVNGGTGLLELALSQDGQIAAADMPTWARFYDNAGVWVFDCDARSSSAPNLGQEVVVQIPVVYVGAYLRIASGTLGLA